MHKLVIKGDKRHLDKLVRENRTRVSRWGLEISISEDKKSKKQIEAEKAEAEKAEAEKAEAEKAEAEKAEAEKAEAEKAEAEKAEAEDKKKKPLGANETIELINNIVILEDLEEFESDTRATVVKAREAKRAELDLQ